ncbi:MAG: sulfite exporter TauE/SafE family protein [Actinobacteria bacterium]|nr:sulfite exporter TauE/SafE family protein [Actinomycetota bacterium]
MSLGHLLLAAGAGALAGAVNAAAGGGTLIAFPALIAAGVGALEANITCSVGLLAGYAGGTLAYRPELEGQAGRVRALIPAGIIGGVAGALVLLATPAHAFRTLAPFLILVSCALLAAQPRLARGLAARGGGPRPTPGPAAWAGVLVAAVYGSYFGAGLGVLVLGVLGILVRDGLQRLNALKGLLSLVINAAGGAVFVASGRVDWAYAVALGVGALVGGTLGVSVARGLRAEVLRAGVVGLGVVVAVVLLVGG